MLCFRKILYEKKVVDKNGGWLGREGVARFSVKFVFSLSAKKMRSGTV